MDSGFLVDTSSEVLGGEDWALLRGAIAGSRVKGRTAVVAVYVRGGVGEGRASEEARRQGVFPWYEA